MENNFFSTTDTNEAPEIVAALIEKGFTQLETSGNTNNILIDGINKTFWFCDNECMESNRTVIEGHHKQKIQQVTLKEIQSWT